MNDQNTQILIKAFPNLFRNDFYFECGDGWFELIAKVAAFIDTVTRDCEIAEVKEKFGRLRIYLSLQLDQEGVPTIPEEELSGIYKFINHVEQLSQDICEDCGVDLNATNRKKRTGYWITNLCVTCQDKRST